MFEFSHDYQFEATGDENQNVVVPDPAPRCKLAIRKDTGDWFVATGVYFKPVESMDGTTFRDSDGGIWRLIVLLPNPTHAPEIAALRAEIERLRESAIRFLKAADAYFDGEDIDDTVLMIEYGDALKAFRAAVAPRQEEANNNG